MTLEIKDFETVTDGTNTVAKFNVYLPNIREIKRNFKIVKTAKGGHFLSLPSYLSHTTDEGKKIWLKYDEYSSDKQKEFEKMIKEELKNFCEFSLL